MNRLLPIALFVALSGAAAHAQSIEKCVRGDSNFLYLSDLDNTVPCQAPPASGDTPLMPQSGTLSSSSLIRSPCCVNFATKAGTITVDLDNDTVDLHGAKLDDAARAFWDAVAQVAGHAAVKRRAYTLDDIDRMRAALEATMAHAIIIDGRSACSKPNSWVLTEVNCPPADAAQIEDRLRTYMAAGITPEELEAKVK